VASEAKYKCTVKKNYAEVPEIFACPGQLNQVLINILINSIQAFDSPGEIEIHTRADAENVFIDIIDDGPGFPQENIIKLFDPFFTTKGVKKGTGLGLYICHGLIQKHRGQIMATNEPGGGARITISLPINMRESIRSATTQPNLE
jgi:two-component system NtrC family sensor kinase